MSQTNLQVYIPSFNVAAAIAANMNVVINGSGQAVLVDKGVQAFGTTARAADPASDDLSKRRVAVIPLNGANCGRHITAGAVVQFAAAYQADGGLVDDVSTGAKLLGVFLESASGAGQEVVIAYTKGTPA